MRPLANYERGQPHSADLHITTESSAPFQLKANVDLEFEYVGGGEKDVYPMRSGAKADRRGGHAASCA